MMLKTIFYLSRLRFLGVVRLLFVFVLSRMPPILVVPPIGRRRRAHDWISGTERIYSTEH